MNYNKKIIISIGIFFSVLLIGMGIINITINFMYPGNELAESIKENFKDSFGKSIKFDTMIFKYNGDIILQNFYLSNTTDFNDNVNLIKCNEVVIDTYLFDLLREKVTFSAVKMYKPEINIIKNYGKSYSDTFINDIVTGIKNDRISQFITKKFSIELTGAKLFYREIFKKSKTFMDFRDVDIVIEYYGNKLEYELDGKIINNNISRWRSCGFDAEGTVQFDKSKSENRVEFDNIDVSLVNNLLAEYYKDPIVFKGRLTGDIQVNTDKDKIDIIAEVNGKDMFASRSSDQMQGYILKNEDITVEADISAMLSMEQIRINKLAVYDGILDVSLNYEYIKGEHLIFAVKSNKIDLSDLSYRFTPVKKSSYNGDFSFNGKLNYNLKEMKPEELALDVKLNRFNLISDETSDSKGMINNCNALITADKEKFLFKTRLDTGNSDIDISFTGRISEWNPFRSKNQVEINSKNMELKLLKSAVTGAINSIYDMAYVDMFQNFDEQRNFLKEPEGIFVNNNDLNLKIKADKLIIVNNAAFDNFNLEMNLEKGIIRTQLFSLQGYDGTFNFDAYAALRQEYPFIKIEGGVQNLNIARIAVDSDSAFQGAGILSSDFKFETNAFRIGQIVENGRAAFNIGIKDGYISGTEDLKKLNAFIKDSGYAESVPEPLTFRNMSFTFMQSSNEYYIRNFSMTGEKCSFSAYGKYQEEEGLSIPLNLNLNINNSYTKVPLMVFGHLMSPCVRINDKKKPDYICF